MAGGEGSALAKKGSSIAMFCVVIVLVIWQGFWLWLFPRCDCIMCLCFLMVHDDKGCVSKMLHDVSGKVLGKVLVVLIAIGMHKTGCSGETKLVLHIPHHELESLIIIVTIIIIIVVNVVMIMLQTKCLDV